MIEYLEGSYLVSSPITGYIPGRLWSSCMIKDVEFIVEPYGIFSLPDCIGTQVFNSSNLISR
jgi:hypothetical protein